jgi:hypothetical protein
VNAPPDRAVHVTAAVMQIIADTATQTEAYEHIEAMLRDEFLDVQRETLSDMGASR